MPRWVEDALEELALHFLPGGWEINEGGYGALTLDVQTRTVCWPLRECLPDPERLDLASFTWCHHNRYLSVNVTHAHEGVEKLEVRMHAGTTAFNKVAAWIALWTHIFNQARYAWAGPAAPGRVFPGGNRPVSLEGVGREDIFALLRAEGIHLGPGLEGWLRRRRAELRPAWQAVLPRRVASWDRAGWYAVA